MARSASAKPPAARAATPPQARAPSQKPKAKAKATANRKADYSSDGVEDNDVFLLPGSDFQLMLGITVLSAVVRLFRIYQPTSVVFDEVQYVYLPLLPFPLPAHSSRLELTVLLLQLWRLRF